MTENPAASPKGVSVPIAHRKTLATVRKITACVACRRLKIKCHMPNAGDPPCVRCRRRGTQCSVSRPLATNDDALWKPALMERLDTMDQAMRNTARQLSALESRLQQSPAHSQPPRQVASGSGVPSPRAWPSGQADTHHHHDDGEVMMDVESGPAIIPSSSVRDIRSGPPSLNDSETCGPPPDLISIGLLTLDEADYFFHIYASRLDHFLYRILGRDAVLADLRKSSRLLVAAVCTVGALHAPGQSPAFDNCYQHLRRVATDVVLAKDAHLDDIRGLCIGAFWLRDVAWNLSAIAVSLATQRHIHQCSLKNPSAISPGLYEEIRLYYLVYICDHHLSIAYGRPPMTAESELIRSSNNFLLVPDSTEDDARIVSQVQVWSTSTQGLNLMGFDVNENVPDALLPPLRRLMISLDTWRANWNERFGHNTHVGNYPRKGVKLHYHFARLYLCSHAFRGLPSSSLHCASICSNSMSPLSSSHNHIDPDLEEVAEAAVVSAKAILRTITADGEIQAHLNGLPLYFNTMIAFAIVFLFKVATRFSGCLKMDSKGAMDIIDEVADALRTTVASMHRRHFLVALTGALDRLLAGHRSTLPAKPQRRGGELSEASSETALLETEGYYQHQPELHFAWNGEEFDWDNFDLLAAGSSLDTGV